ncbi:hypothetical protein EDD11_001757 [Mortierella claussenii]|nr:hypothetical protein EDD11_001757 [Mortierella claussenii]
MNLQLLDPFEQDFPEVIEDTLEDGPAVTVKFNRRGTLLAAGCSDGTIVIWDFDTRGVSRSLIGHVKTITSLSSVFIAALHQEKPVLVDFSSGIKRSPILLNPSTKVESAESTTTTGPMQWILVVTFDKQGKKIYTGSNRGQISIIDAESRSILYEMRPTTSAIKNIQFSRKGREIVVNANDRIIRLFATREDGPPDQLLHKFQDLVNRIQWNQCCFSSDSDYVIGGSAHQAEHNIFIWDKIRGDLVKILEGPKEPLEDLAWHPVRPIVASVSSYGTIHIWATNYQENWSAFAPDFKELEENIDYEEREDEFDIVPEDEASKRKQVDEDVLIDVTTIEKINPFSDSDSEDGDEETFYLPLLPNDQQDEGLIHHKHHHRRHRDRHHRHPEQHRHSNGNSRQSRRQQDDHSHGHRQSQSHRDLASQNAVMFPSSPLAGETSSHRAVGHSSSNNNSIIKDETAEHSTETRKRDHADHVRSHDRDRGRGRERERDRDRERERDLGEKAHKHRQHRSEEDDLEAESKYGHDHSSYENIAVNGNDYDRDREHHRSHSNSSVRRRSDEQPSLSRSIKRQR